MDSWSNLCRCCLSPDSNVSLFDEKQNVKEKFFELTTIKANKDDGLPQKLCVECFTILNSAYQFRVQCMKMDKELKVQLDALLKPNKEKHFVLDLPNIIEKGKELTVEDIANESMKQIEALIKTEPNDSDDDCYYVLVIDDPKDNDKEKNNEDYSHIKIEPKFEEHPAEHNEPEEQDGNFENSIDSFLVTNPPVSFNVPATILENEDESQGNDEQTEMNVDGGDENSQEHNAEMDESQLSNSQELMTIGDDIIVKDISSSSNIIKILTTSGLERTILLNSKEGVKYLTDSQLTTGEDGDSSQQEFILYEGDDSSQSQFQILKCDGSELVIEYADDSQIPSAVLQQVDGLYLCDCGEKFEDLDEYEKHKQKHNPAGEYLCNLCGKGFETAEILKGHMLLHSVTGLFVTCPFCSQLIKRNALTQHIKYGHNFKPRCNLCLKTFANLNNLKRHMMIHTGIREFQCDICLKRFHQKITMQTHRLTHINPFSCNQCDMTFENKAALTEHKHSEECSKSRVTKVKEELIKTVKQEITTDLGKLLGYACSLCKRMFSVESALEQHIESTHMAESTDAQNADKNMRGKLLKRFECSICGKSCASQAMLIMHERVHTNERPYPCQLCSLRFKTKTHLRTHQLTHTREKKFGCSVCMKFFALKGNLVVHLRTHTGERPYVCSICDEAFIDSKYLKKHKLKKHAVDNVAWNKY
ncbi:uncharacterized protein [Epargyreus clarus]|uniref:uncharacterized protein n=1 Tax=Epargyreus clarus TaxID=520877 RepID=UPI003C2CAA3F